MYWYYKLTFGLIVLVIVLGVGHLAWRKFSPASPAEGEPVTLKTERVPEPPVPVPDVVPDRVPESRDFRPAENSATPIVDVIPPAPVAPPSVRVSTQDIERQLALAEDQLAKQNLVAARNVARRVIGTDGVEEFGAIWERAAAVISQANTALSNSDAPSPEKIAYKVEDGDSLVRIAYRHKTTVGALQRLNRLDPTDPMIFAGNIL